MTIREAYLSGVKRLRKRSSSAAIDAEILLAHALGATREEMLTHDDRALPARTLARFLKLIARRAEHEPIAYITGHKEFFGLGYFVNKQVLIPRPETETLVELALSKLQTTNCKLVIDIGTGSGAIAISIAKNSLRTTVIATDLSAPALRLAAKNATANDVADCIVFKKGDLFAPALAYLTDRTVKQATIIITANLPYLTTTQWRKTAPDVRHFEPRTALDGGQDGLGLYNRLFDQIASCLSKSNFDKLTVLCEIDPGQKKKFVALGRRHFPKAVIAIKNDLAGYARVVAISLQV